MRVTQWETEVPYKNLQEMSSFEGGMNTRFSPSLIADSQATSMVNSYVDSDGSVVQLTQYLDADVPAASYSKAGRKVFGSIGYNDGVIVISGIQSAPTQFDVGYITVYDRIAGFLNEIDVSDGIVGLGHTIPIFIGNRVDMCQFNTEVGQYIIMSCRDWDSPLIFNPVAMMVAEATPSVNNYFTSVASYANRVFIARDNKIWWTKAGTNGAASTDWYGGNPGETETENYVTADNGYWTLEKETNISWLCVIHGDLVIMTPVNMYRFSGYAPENFTLSILVANIGVSSTQMNRPPIIGDRMWFLFSQFIYEYTLGYQPVIVSEPIPSLASSVQAVSGGFAVVDTSYPFVLEADDTNLYFSSSLSTYVFNHLLRKWHKETAYVTDAIVNFYSTANAIDADGNRYVIFVHNVNPGSGDEYYVYYGRCPSNGIMQLITKAFSSGPMAVSVLHSMWLQYVLLSNTTTIADISVYVSRLESGDSDWERVHFASDVQYDGMIRTDRVLVPNKYNKMSPFYRIKITASGCPIRLFPYTREIRSNVRT